MMYYKVMAEPLFLTFPIINMIYEQIHTIFLLVNIFILRKRENLGSENHTIFASLYILQRNREVQINFHLVDFTITMPVIVLLFTT